jgi:hypothetical protein
VRGADVIGIDPPGKYYPRYEREKYRGPVQWKKVKRFIAEDQPTL